MWITEKKSKKVRVTKMWFCCLKSCALFEHTKALVTKAVQRVKGELCVTGGLGSNSDGSGSNSRKWHKNDNHRKVFIHLFIMR